MNASYRSARLSIGAALVGGLMISCTNDPPLAPDPPITDPAELQFAPELSVDLDAMTLTSSGLYFLDEEEGDGEPAEAGDQVTVHYTGWFHDGLKFDSSIDRDEPFTIESLAGGTVIPGWDEGLQGMREGGHRLLVVPPTLAYGPNPVEGRSWATLIFRVEMLEISQPPAAITDG